MAVRVPIGAREDDTDDLGVAGEAAKFEDVLADAAFLQRYCERLLGDPVGAEDIVQETVLQAFRRVGDLDRRGSFAPWLATVAKRSILKELRRRQRLHLVEDLPESAWQADSEPEAIVTSAASVEATVHAFDALNERERALLVRQVRDGLTITELAAEEQSTVASVKSVLNRARAKLRAVVDGAHARVLAPVASAVTSARRHLSQLGWRVQQASPALPAGVERVGEVVTAAVATLVMSGSVGATPGLPFRIDGQSAASISASIADVETPRAGPDRTAPRLDSPVAPTAVVPVPEPRGAANADEDSRGASVPKPLGTAGSAPTPPTIESGAPPEAPSPLPKDDGDDPEGSFFKDITWVGGQDASGTQSTEVFALGELKGRCDTACTVLFHSRDGGAVWHRLPAEGIGDDAHTLLVAPRYPDDPRIYVMTASGMRRSLDAGSSFHAVNHPNNGPVAMSPAFSDGDARVLVGAGPGGWSYDAGADTSEPFSPGSFVTTEINFAFAPEDARTVYAGHFVHGDGKAKRPAVTRCDGDQCRQRVLLPGSTVAPSVFVGAPVPGAPRLVLAWHDGGLFRSADAGATFDRVELGANGTITTVTQDDAGTLYLGWWRQDANDKTGGVLRSSDQGKTWSSVGAGTSLDSGVHEVAARGDGWILATPRWAPDGGILCSTDGGATWLPRCPGRGSASTL